MRILLVLFLLAALSGCTGSVDPYPLTAREEIRQAPESTEFPGLVVVGALRVTPDGVVVDATARNDGNRTYQVETGCTTPWTALLFRGDERLETQRPTARCAAFALRDFVPGETLTFNATWDGTIWDATAARQIAAPRGEYEFSIRFVAYHEERIRRADLDFQVTVG